MTFSKRNAMYFLLAPRCKTERFSPQPKDDPCRRATRVFTLSFATSSALGLNCSWLCEETQCIQVRCIRFDLFHEIQFHVFTFCVRIWSKEYLKRLVLLALDDLLKVQAVGAHGRCSADRTILWQHFARCTEKPIDPKDPFAWLSTVLAILFGISEVYFSSCS